MSTSVDYLDFELEIERGKEDAEPFLAAILKSPAGQAREPFRFPFELRAMAAYLRQLRTAVRDSQPAVAAASAAAPTTVPALGAALFDSVLGAGVRRDMYESSRRLAEHAHTPLRLMVRTDVPDIATLPWEFLYDSRREQFLALSGAVSVVRYLALPRGVEALEVQPPLRVLGMIASPEELAQLDADAERARVTAALAPLVARGLVDLSWVDGQGWRDLQRFLRRGPWHVLHFIGHGGVDAGAGHIVLVDETTGRADLLGADRLGQLLGDQFSLRLVVLNACEGAREGTGQSISSAAALLMRVGVPAVVAMQYSIGDRAAVEFARTFYDALADGQVVDAAVSGARVAMSLAQRNSYDWGVPVLNLRTPDSRLFARAAKPEPVGRRQSAAATTAAGGGVEVFISYAAADERFLVAIEDHLSGLENQHLIRIWHQRRITAGTDRATEIEEHLNSAAVILLLISPSYHQDSELKRALERDAEGSARVIPILVRSVDWRSAAYGKLQPLPVNERFVTDWPRRDAAWTEIVSGIRAAISRLQPGGQRLD